MELYYSFSVLIVLASFFAYLNYRVLKLPSTIGIMIIAIVASIALRIGGTAMFPKTSFSFFKMISEFDFTEVLMGAMLNFLLFAGAIHINFSDLKKQGLPIITFSTLGIILSTTFIGSIIFYVAPFFNIELPFIYCLLFGSLISPTDPIAVLGILKKTKVPKSIEIKIAGESLFNDGVAVVIFAVLLQIAQTKGIEISASNISWLFLKEAGGGLILGTLLGLSAANALRKVDDYSVAVLITLSVVMGGYLIAHSFHFSGPLTMVAAGLFMGNIGRRRKSPSVVKEYIIMFWELIDNILNAILFLFIGLELLLIPDLTAHWLFGVSAILIVLLARFLSIWLPFLIIPIKPKFSKGTLSILVWGGLRGGVSIALVLSLHPGAYKDLLLEITYFIVVFSIIVQGLTIGKVADKILTKKVG